MLQVDDNIIMMAVKTVNNKIYLQLPFNQVLFIIKPIVFISTNRYHDKDASFMTESTSTDVSLSHKNNVDPMKERSE